MNLKERTREIIEIFKEHKRYTKLMEDLFFMDKVEYDLNKLKAAELDEEKILGIIKDVQIPAKPDNDETYLHLEWIEAVAKAIAKGDVYKEKR